MPEQDVGVRAEIGALRSDIRHLSDVVQTGFERLDSRVRVTEDKLTDMRARDDERTKMLRSGQDNILSQKIERPPLHRDFRTYAGGGIGTLLFVVYEFAKAAIASGKGP